ncbi:endonuclease/exonuclease/phosphatase family protein [Thalassoroseus pseudoceratinae]|uniref:endonuclease/exonuclease/phosphatase family protein n=1 Tax=Thalassoroseus pseudoceratinae TaxID=2713176 RepID=UPI00198065AD|nr:endonuclease/exonuclease/phosphatase family protein [Thalassoroseus pseudoceratinae]
MTLSAQEKTNSASHNAPIKVMSFNIRYGAANDGENHWKHRANLVGETIELFNPDLLGTQEVLKFQAEFLKEKLPEYGFHGVGRQDGTEEGEYVPVMYRKDRFKVIDSGFYWLSETPDVPGSKSWDSSLPRMASWVKLEDLQSNGSEFVFVNTHFDHRGPSARLESARLIRRQVDKLERQGIPVIITGDFNTTEDGQPYQALVQGPNDDDKPLVDSYRQSYPERSRNEATFSRWVGHREGSRIDWILHSQDFTTLNSSINYTNENGKHPSDHYPVQAILRLKPQR